MLSIGKLSRGREAYYLSTVVAGKDHGTGLVEPDGYWLGEGARLLGLEGCAEPAALRRVMAGRHPASGERLVSDRVHLAAFDCCFSTPKSVSMIHALGVDGVTSEVRAAHDEAVAATVGYLEREAAAARLGGEVTRAAGFVACGFPHRLSRAPDPHLHTHVLVANLVPASREQWRPLDARWLFVEARTAGALFETHLRHELTRRLGVTWQPLRGAWADIAGIDRAQVIGYSRRATEIRALTAAEGLVGAEAGRIVAGNSRPPKPLDRPYSAIVEEWRQTSWSLGISAGYLASLTPGPSADRPAPEHGFEDDVVRRLAESSPDGSFTRRQAVVARCAAAPDGVSVSRAEQDVDRLLASSRVVAAMPSPRVAAPGSGSAAPGRGRLFTTPQTVAAHERVAGLVTAMASSVTVLAYEPGGRLRALDELARAAAVWCSGGQSVLALAPGRRAAAAFEAATGIEAVAGGSASSVLGRASVLAVPDAHRLGPAALESLVTGAGERADSLVLLAPRTAVGRHAALGGIARQATGSLPAALDPCVAECPPRRYSFPGCDVAVVSSPESARMAAVAWAATLSSSGGPSTVVLVAGDEAAVGELSAVTRQLGATSRSRLHVTHARRLDAVLSPDAGPAAVVCLGGAGVLQRGTERLAAVDRCHVVLAPSGGGTEPGRAHLALAAEAARPRHLTTELGAVPHDPLQRAVWREAAMAIETHRSRFAIDDDRRAYGLPDRDEPAVRAEDRGRTQAEVAPLVRELRLGRELAREQGRARTSGLGLERTPGTGLER